MKILAVLLFNCKSILCLHFVICVAFVSQLNYSAIVYQLLNRYYYILVAVPQYLDMPVTSTNVDLYFVTFVDVLCDIIHNGIGHRPFF